jgi:hypothetical protein
MLEAGIPKHRPLAAQIERAAYPGLGSSANGPAQFGHSTFFFFPSLFCFSSFFIFHFPFSFSVFLFCLEFIFLFKFDFFSSYF